MTKKHSQIVVRITSETEKKIKRLSEKEEMTKAAWVRRLILKETTQAKNG